MSEEGKLPFEVSYIYNNQKTQYLLMAIGHEDAYEKFKQDLKKQEIDINLVHVLSVEKAMNGKHVSLSDMSVPFFSLVGFYLKSALAAIPAIALLAGLYLVSMNFLSNL